MYKTKKKPDAGRKGIVVMGQLLGLVKPLMHVMLLAVILGAAGNLCAIAITALGGYGLVSVLGSPVHSSLSLKTIFLLLCAFGVLRGIFRYGEQFCNHYIAFKLLALLRQKVFGVLQKLAPARLEGREKGNLISIITADIELLEVFYAHTISPILIACITSLMLSVYLGSFHWVYGVLGAASYFLVGVVYPMILSRAGKGKGLVYRNAVGRMNSFFLDSLRGLTQILQFHQGEKRRESIRKGTKDLEEKQRSFKMLEGITRSINDTGVILCSVVLLLTGIYFYQKGELEASAVIIPFLTMMGSFGPVLALSSLSNNLMHTLASGNRVLDLLEETPAVEEVTGQENLSFQGAVCEEISYQYEEEEVIKDLSLPFEEKKIIGLYGRSGCGKSTLLKLLLRFFDVEKGKILISGKNITSVNTDNLRELEGYVTQETYIFHGTLADNIGIAKEGAKREEIEAAARKASLHEFIAGLPYGYDTDTGELGEKLSGGERQRIGIARAFLQDGPFLLLDEPTSNLDSLNEGIILKSLQKEKGTKTVVLVSHRKSTLNIADITYNLDRVQNISEQV